MHDSPLAPEKMRLVLEVARHLAVTADLKLLLRRIAEAAIHLLGAERASIYLHDPPGRVLCTWVATGEEECIRIPDDVGIAGAVFQAKEPLNIPDAYADPRFNKEIDRKLGFVTRNLLTAPMLDLSGTATGVIQAINKTGGSFLREDEILLALLADQAGVAIQRYHLQRDAERNAELRQEMLLAKGVQLAMIPKRPPRVRQLRAAGWTLPASITGGDLYDLWEMPGGQLGVFLGDATGHGVGPALVVSQARTLLRSLSEIDCAPRWLLERVNARLAADLEPDRFVTAFAACVTPEGHLRWWSAGHGPIYLRRSAGEPFESHNPPAPPVGVMAELDGDEVEPVELAPGGMLVVMSDGIFEARNAGGALFGYDRVKRMLDGCGGQTPEQIIACFRQSMRDYQGHEEPIDDQTMVVVEREG